MNIDEMTAGRELDALVCELVMGWRREPQWGLTTMGKPNKPSPEGTCSVTSEVVPHYSTDIAAAWEVVEKLCELDEFCLITYFGSGGKVDGWVCELMSDYKHDRMKALTAPLAICRAALKAVMK